MFHKRQNMRIKRLFFIILVIYSTFTWADDAVEAAATGNIVFEKAPELIMQDETLTITKSAGKNFSDDNFSVDVDFHFKNISDHAVTRKIAFVLPPVQCRMDANFMWRGLDANDEYDLQNKGLKDFTTTVDGKPQSYTIKTEAMLGQRNITTLLNKLQIPLNPCKIQPTSTGEPDPRYRANLTQTFPAGKTIHIHHHYTPSIGESVPSPRPITELNDQFPKATPPLWNRDPATLAESHPSIVYTKTDLGKQKRFCVMPKWVRYHLKTGAYWKGGIQHFKLIVKDAANAPFAVNQFYKKIDNAHLVINNDTMSFVIDHFVPAENLFVLFLSLPHSKEDLQACGI
jgi:hypothetical protein